MTDRLKYYWNTLTDKYVIQVNYVEIPEGETIPVLVEKKYIVSDDKKNATDYTDDIDKASIFGIVLGGIVIKKLRAECKDLPNLQFDLVSLGNAHFIDTITKGTIAPFNNFVKGPIDFASDDLHKKYLEIPSVLGTGVAAKMDTDKKTMQEWLEVHVKNEETKKLIEKEFEGGQYKGFPIKVRVIVPMVPQKKAA
jgi:hypothetical protein